MDKRTIAGGAILTVAALAALYWPGGDAPTLQGVERLQPTQITARTISGDRVSRSAVERIGVAGDRVERIRSRPRAAILERLHVAKETREAVREIRPTLLAPDFYVAIGEVEAGAVGRATLDPRQRYTLYFSDLDANDDALRLAADSVCILDFAPGEFDGPAIEDFVRKTHCREVVFAWHRANATTYTNEKMFEDIATDIASAVEYAKRGDPDVFVWVCAVYGYPASAAWAEAIKGIPFDGVALWGPHTLPIGWRAPFLAEPLRWARLQFGGRPVAYVSLYVTYRAFGFAEGEAAETTRARVAVEIPKAIAACRELGYAAVWRQVGSIPDHIFKGLEPPRGD